MKKSPLSELNYFVNDNKTKLIDIKVFQLQNKKKDSIFD